MRRSIAQRKAARVFPLPVGERMSACSPRAITGQPRACGAVGRANDWANQSRTEGRKSESGEDMCVTL